MAPTIKPKKKPTEVSTPTAEKAAPPVKDQLGNTPQDYAQKEVKIETRPTGTDVSQNRDITALNKEQRAEESLISGIAGKQLEAEKRGVKLSDVLANARAAELQKQEAEGQKTEMTDFEQLKQQAPVVPTAFEAQQPKIQEIFSGEKAGTVQGSAEILGTGIIGGIQTTVQIVDNLRALTSLGGKDTMRVKDARTLMTQNNALIAAEIKNVALGGDSTVAEDALRRSISSNNVLHSDAHRKGLDNLRYWLGGGADIEEEAIINDQQLKNLVDQLNQAKIMGATRGRI